MSVLVTIFLPLLVGYYLGARYPEASLRPVRLLLLGVRGRRMDPAERDALELELGLRELTDAECDDLLVPRIMYTQRAAIDDEMRERLREDMRVMHGASRLW